MNKITLIITFLAFSLLTNAQIQNYNLNDVVDDFTVTDIHGVEHNLYSYTAQGKYVFLDFFFDTCPPCQGMAPTWNEFYDKYGCNEGDVICITMNNGSDSDAEVEAFENTYGGSFNHSPAVSADGGAGAVDSNFNPTAYPTVCLINPTNQIIELDIWPINGVETLEATFPSGFNPLVAECSASAGINDLNTNDFSIYPNPSKDGNISIKLNGVYGNVNVSIIDILGKQLYTNDFTSADINLELDLSSGAYFVHIKSDNAISTKKLIIK